MADAAQPGHDLDALRGSEAVVLAIDPSAAVGTPGRVAFVANLEVLQASQG